MNLKPTPTPTVNTELVPLPNSTKTDAQIKKYYAYNFHMWSDTHMQISYHQKLEEP